MVKEYSWDENKPTVFCRTGTDDLDIFLSLLVRREKYIFPKQLDPGVIFDIGAHIGVASVLLANLYPRAKIHAFEPESENFDLLRANCEGYPNIILHAVGLSAKTGLKNLYNPKDKRNQSEHSNFIEHADKTVCKVLSAKTAVESYGVPDLIKINCMGAESEILRNFSSLDLVSWMTGQLHSVDAEFLMFHVLSTHFKISIKKQFADRNWGFHAANKLCMDLGPDTTFQDDKNGLAGNHEPVQTVD